MRPVSRRGRIGLVAASITAVVLAPLATTSTAAAVEITGARTLSDTMHVNFAAADPAKPPSAVHLFAFNDFHFRYFGAMWAAWGGLTYWAATDVRERAVPLKILWGFMVLGGLGRAHSAWKYGFSNASAVVATVTEFVLPGVALAWMG